MTLLFASKSDSGEDWRAELARLMPDRTVRIWPEIGRREDIRYALVWNPEPGMLATLPNLEVIFSLGAGVDGLLKDPALPDKPIVRMVEDGLTEGMTEYVVMEVLRHHRQIDAYRTRQRAGQWRPLPQKLAHERRVGILGLGVLGADAARMLAALRFDVAGWSRSAKTIPGVECFHGSDGLALFLSGCEILICLLPLTPETRGILNARTFAALPPGAYLINAARGGHLAEADLLAALDEGRLSGASLDVFATEPLPPGHPFWTHPRIMVTPHVASVTHVRGSAAHIVEGIRRYERGLPLENLVDRDKGY